MKKLIIENTPIKDLYVIKLNPAYDERGYFERLFCNKELEPILKKPIKQINHSMTKNKGAIRGMHYQLPPMAETKIIKCIKGSIFDVAVDLRKNSPTFLKWHYEILSEDNDKMFFIPEGFAHGFQSLQDNAEIIYFVTEYYNKDLEGCLSYNDDKLNIKWPIKATNLSEKDKNCPLLNSEFKGIII